MNNRGYDVSEVSKIDRLLDKFDTGVKMHSKHKLMFIKAYLDKKIQIHFQKEINGAITVNEIAEYFKELKLNANYS